ncbi:hypothetical protein GUITHDRAFT_113835 [Guillardia theta CCMP2712]|uniref:Uncharacterized protein n=1 Tax=Guillardia theta (strain CCMP2712) TaxID=905079 RepID=L1IV27_GUITC|nr:hypothetical protein GUITHDRAFT_113835 [Guillardia theta CCMP2712]EKX40098.1 hypothetical protein GUITHDRAFT_113835 [Guillardia theta CCMP2712]|eukprot:XP_005827078.1 hypothetical protein GUITHDRAFT_113835 [Guillardia theta CCMP2712]
MGCRESKPNADEAPKWSKFQDATGECVINQGMSSNAMTLDDTLLVAEEEEAHLHAWKDPKTRNRVETQMPEEYADTTYERILENLENYAALKKQKAANDSRSAVSAEHGKPEGNREDETSASSRLKKLELAQAQKKKQELLELEPGVWKRYALESRYQQGEDLLLQAQGEESAERGRYGLFLFNDRGFDVFLTRSTKRLAELKHAVALLYDYRSNLDVTGQQQFLSYVSYKHAKEALGVWKEVEDLVKEDQNMARMVQILKSETMLLMGKSLCNFALDGDGDKSRHDLSAKEAFHKAKEILEEVETIRRGQDAALAETVMALGYLSYCQAGAASNAGPRCSLHLSEKEIECLYNSALHYYKEALELYVKCYGKDHNDSIRMICNIALVHKAKGLVFKRLDELEKAEICYKEALSCQGSDTDSHLRAKKIKMDLAEIEVLKENNMVMPEIVSQEDEASQKRREEEASALMEEFLVSIISILTGQH